MTIEDELHMELARLQEDKASLTRRVRELEEAATDRFRTEWKNGSGNPFREAAERCADERLVELKHAGREAIARAEEAERQLAITHEALARVMQECSDIARSALARVAK